MSESTADAASDFAAVVVAAGRSTRFADGVAKQFRLLAGRSVLEHAVAAFATHPAVRQIVVVLPAAEVDGPRGAAVGTWRGVSSVVAGGASRVESVRAGLAAVSDARYVLIHDGARPRIGSAVIDRVVEATRSAGAAIPVVPLTDTVKQLDSHGRIERTLDRSLLRAAQTPQGFRRDWLSEALDRLDPVRSGPTDEAAALEAVGRTIAHVRGDPGNVKITGAGDLAALQRELEGAMLRIGTGFDIHRFADGRRCVLGGVVFEGERGLEGHSDADVILHAAMDALLGAAGMGDIGSHFPPGDPTWKDASSVDLSRRVRILLDEAGWEIVNLDLTLLAERPKVGPRAAEIRDSIAAAFSTTADRVGLKATTLEGLGALGRGDGAACQAAALLQRRPDRPA